MRIRQVALVARDLESTVADLCAILGIEVAYRDPAVEVFGLANAVLPVGESFLEVVTPARPETTAERFLKRRHGDGGYMVMVQTDDLAAARGRAESLGVRVAWSVDLDEASAIHLHPKDTGAAILSFDQMHSWNDWLWAGPDWRGHVRTDVVTGVAGVEIQAADIGALARRWSEVLAAPLEERDGEPCIAVGDTYVRFVPDRDGRGDGVRGVDLRFRDEVPFLAHARERGLQVQGRAVCAGGTWFRPA